MKVLKFFESNDAMDCLPVYLSKAADVSNETCKFICEFSFRRIILLVKSYQLLTSLTVQLFENGHFNKPK